MQHSNVFTFDTEVLAFWHSQAQLQNAAFDAYLAYLG